MTASTSYNVKPANIKEVSFHPFNRYNLDK